MHEGGSSLDAFETLAYSSLLRRDLETSIEGGWIMDKREAKRKLNHAVGRAKRQVGELTDETKGQVEDLAHQVKDKAEHALDKMKHMAHDAKEKVTS